MVMTYVGTSPGSAVIYKLMARYPDAPPTLTATWLGPRNVSPAPATQGTRVQVKAGEDTMCKTPCGSMPVQNALHSCDSPAKERFCLESHICAENLE